jgi:hypothetical protein
MRNIFLGYKMDTFSARMGFGEKRATLQINEMDEAVKAGIFERSNASS